VSRKWRNWYQNEVDEEINGVDSRDQVKHNEMSNQLFLERMMKVTEMIMLWKIYPDPVRGFFCVHSRRCAPYVTPVLALTLH